MGMTDRQFDSYQGRILELLLEALEEIKKSGESKKLEKLIAAIEAELKRP